MVRRSLVAMATALTLVAATAQAAPARVASPLAASESLTEDDDWMLPVAAIALVILIILLDDANNEDAPVSP